MDLPNAGNQYGRIHGARHRQRTEGAANGYPESRDEEAVFKSRCGCRQSLRRGNPSPRWPPPHSVATLQRILHHGYPKHILGTLPPSEPGAGASRAPVHCPRLHSLAEPQQRSNSNGVPCVDRRVRGPSPELSPGRGADGGTHLPDVPKPATTMGRTPQQRFRYRRAQAKVHIQGSSSPQ